MQRALQCAERHAEAVRIGHARPDADRSRDTLKTYFTAALIILFEPRRLNECLKLLKRRASGRRPNNRRQHDSSHGRPSEVAHDESPHDLLSTLQVVFR